MGVTLESGGVGSSRAGGERASSGRKEGLGAEAMAAMRWSGRRELEGQETRARAPLAQSFRPGARSAAAAALISWRNLPLWMSSDVASTIWRRRRGIIYYRKLGDKPHFKMDMTTLLPVVNDD
jgi:hypothetical protein